jgi:hypothetical protein
VLESLSARVASFNAQRLHSAEWPVSADHRSTAIMVMMIVIEPRSVA